MTLTSTRFPQQYCKNPGHDLDLHMTAAPSVKRRKMSEAVVRLVSNRSITSRNWIAIVWLPKAKLKDTRKPAVGNNNNNYHNR